MAVQLKPLSEQVIVITGASSGIGLATARLAARQGARVVLAARNDQELQKLVAEIQDQGGQATAAIADVGDPDDVQKIADAAIQAFGGFDTWVNNAGISMYGKIEEISLEDARRLFDTNFWGVVHGSRVALRTLRERGGALINIGSIVSEQAVPLQNYYSASKHAVSGFTDSLRMEVEHDGLPISVTLIMPAAMDTPFIDHARTYTEYEPSIPPPVYAPENVAEAILHCAQHPKHHVTVGGGGKLMTALGNHMPWLMDKVMEWTMFQAQQKNKPADPLRHDALYRPTRGGEVRGSYEGMVRQRSYYTQAELHPVAAGLAAAAVGVGALALLGAVGAYATRQSRHAAHFHEGESPTRGPGDLSRRHPGDVDYEATNFPEEGYTQGRGI